MATVATAQPVDNSVNSLETAAKFSPYDGGAYAELASAYLRAGRTNDAVSAYRRVLKLDNVMLETRSGQSVWSHQVARRVLEQNAQATYTSL